ncbi:MAG TPA: glycosyltransferase [Candidatus Paceibacterota bacterium]
MNPLYISVVTPTLNRAKLLEKNLKSILDQEYPYIEHIVVDGISKDGTVELLMAYELKYAAKGCKLRWISEKDKNHTSAVNKGFKLATGDYVGFMYSDEYWASGAIRKLVEEIQKDPPLDILYGDVFQYYEDSKEIKRLLFRQYSLKDLIYSGEQIPLAGAVVRRAFFDKVGYLKENLEFVAEHDFLVRCIEYGAKSYYVHFPIAYIFEHSMRKVLLDIPASWKETKKVNFAHGAHYLTPFYMNYVANMYLRPVFDVMKSRAPGLYNALKKVKDSL